MGDVSRVNKLVELIFHKEIPTLSEMTYAHSSLPVCMLKRLFSQSLLIVLKTKYIIVRNRYRKFIETCFYKIFRSHEMYITYLMYACQAELVRSLKVFDSFIGICSLLMFVSDETKCQTELDFSNLNVDIFMVFYQDMMHELFRKAGGLKKFAKYILNHEYLKPFDNVLTVCVDTCPVKICLEDMLSEVIFDHDVILMNETSLSLAKKVLLKISAKLPTFIMHELIKKRIASTRIEMAKKDGEKSGIEKVLDPELCRKVLEKCFKPKGDSKINQETAQREDNAEKKFVQAVMASNSDSETNLTVEQKEDNVEKEDIVQKVLRYNLLESPGFLDCDSNILKRAYDILEHLKISIQYLIKILDEYDEE